MNGKNIKPKVKWTGLIDTFMVKGVGEYKVVREAKGIAPWGSIIKAELSESEIDRSILISLPEQNGFLLAILDGLMWEIWITPRDEIHIVRPMTETRYPPEEYLTLTRMGPVKSSSDRRGCKNRLTL